MSTTEEIFITNSFEETQKLGKDFLIRILLEQGVSLSNNVKRHPPCVVLIALRGELGSGKTTFVQGLAEGLEIKRRIISPTFVFIRQYRVYSSSEQSSSRSNVIPAKAGIQIPDQVRNDKISSRQARTIYFYHIDLYRINNEKDIERLGIGEILRDPQNIVAIEWPEKMGKMLPKRRWDVKFEYLSENKRRITIKSSKVKNQKSKLQFKIQN